MQPKFNQSTQLSMGEVSTWQLIGCPYFNPPEGIHCNESYFESLANAAKKSVGIVVIKENHSDGFGYLASQFTPGYGQAKADPVFGVEYKTHKTGQGTYNNLIKILCQLLGDCVIRFNGSWSKFKTSGMKALLMESPNFNAYIPIKDTTHAFLKQLFLLIKKCVKWCEQSTKELCSPSKLWSNIELRTNIIAVASQYSKNLIRVFDPKEVSYKTFISNALAQI